MIIRNKIELYDALDKCTKIYLSSANSINEVSGGIPYADTAVVTLSNPDDIRDILSRYEDEIIENSRISRDVVARGIEYKTGYDPGTFKVSNDQISLMHNQAAINVFVTVPNNAKNSGEDINNLESWLNGAVVLELKIFIVRDSNYKTDEVEDF